jgi:hypothetical protein
VDERRDVLSQSLRRGRGAFRFGLRHERLRNGDCESSRRYLRERHGGVSAGYPCCRMVVPWMDRRRPGY